MQLVTFRIINAEYPILINTDHIATIMWSGVNKTEIRMTTGAVHIVEGDFESIQKRLRTYIVPVDVRPDGDK